MKCAIMQPTYLPWAGYFNLIVSVDSFVYLDDVQFERRSWQSRNRILLNGNEHLLSSSTIKSKKETLLCDVLLSEHNDWRKKHINTLKRAYGNAPYGNEMLDIVVPILENNQIRKLSDLNICLVEKFCNSMDVVTSFCRASDLMCGGKRSEHLANICDALSADCYLSPVGSQRYLEEDRFTEKYPINLIFQLFRPQSYSQLQTNDFIGHLSIVDVYASLGSKMTKKYIMGEVIC